MKTTIIITVLTSIFSVNCFGYRAERLSRTADFAPQGVNEDSLQVSSAARICAVEKMSGGDVGAKINACDKMLGAQSGEIRLTGGGNIATQVVVSTGHTLRVVSGNYTATTNGAVIRLRDNSTLACDSLTPVLEESKGSVGDTSPFTIVTPYNGASADAPNGALSQNILIKGCHLKGARTDFNSAPSAIALSNCHNCRVEGNWLESTRSIGINVGGSAIMRQYAQNVSVTGNKLTSVASQNISVVNADTVTISNNRMISPGQAGGPGVAVFDIEPNDGSDRVMNVSFTDNFIDATKNTHASVLFCVVVQNGAGAQPFNNIEINNNQIIGADHSQKDMDWILFAGILVRSASGVRVEGNHVVRTVRGILVDYGSTGVTLNANRLTSCGSGSTNAFIIENSNNNKITGNILDNDPGDVLALPDYIFQSIVEIGTSNNNIFSGNKGRVATSGRGSRNTP